MATKPALARTQPDQASQAAPEFARHWSIRRGAGLDGLSLQSRIVQAPTGNDVLVRIRAVGLNYRDLMVARGQSGAADRAIVPGSDAAGEVIAIGSAVTSLRVGDRVISTFFPDWITGPQTDESTARGLGGSIDGVLAETVVLPESAWVPMPSNLGFAEAATLSCAGVTAWNALFCVEPLPPGATVALLGSGSVSLWALQLSKAAGYRVIITSSDDAKLRRLRELGADATVNYHATPDWGGEVRRLAGGQGAHRVLDIGGPETLAQSIDSVRTGGSVAMIGRLTGNTPVQFDPAAIFLANKRLLGVMVGSRAMTDGLARFVEQARLRPVIDREFDFMQLREAYDYLQSGQRMGKVVVTA